MSDTQTTCEIDADIAGDVMGWESISMPITNRQFDSFVGPYDPERGQFIVQDGAVMRRTSHRRWMPWSPSTDIAAAWDVVAKMREHADPARQNLRLVAWSYSRTYASFGVDDDGGWSEANGEYATPHAICLAALKACGFGRALPGGGEPAP